MDYATVYISLNVNLYLVWQTSLQLSQFVLDYATVYISLIVNLYLAEQTGLQFNHFVLDYGTVYISLIVNLKRETSTMSVKFNAWPICNEQCNCVYKFKCKLVFSTANKSTVKPICNGLCNCV